ncbi:unnamed protein product (macronuclear) [Paramecium tetraurelia]|uniref:Uncharacterized protein n=1 Tax=Paramecium tetraurelia TaxID=5888 RepID=A0BNQ8_PARTE|nr:uncharacterized protein GSPATT00030814001 [Paramecium tetraurelia]CAK60175.1 unnamed protein product [Paramecium tetraurelia]|eukprot:XP_001427573.1 hypothetical protein (macronuclear) [Paramecium tetraurelia strain d4-2]
MFLFQKRLMNLSQSSQQPIRLKPKFYSQQKENMPVQRDLPKVNLINKLNEASKIPKPQPKQQVQITQKTISKDIWHKKSVSMKMRNANLKDGKKIVCGQLIKYKKGDQIYAFRCIKDTMKQCKLKDIQQDHDVDTDDEQIFIATKNMFTSLCQSIKRELFHNEDNQNENKIVLDDDLL